MELGGLLQVSITLSLRRDPPVTIGQQNGWVSEPIWAFWGRGEVLLPPEIIIRISWNPVHNPVSLLSEISRLVTNVKLHNEELNDLYSLPNIVRVVKSRRMRWAGHVARMGEDRGVHRALVGKPEWKRPLGRPRRKWEDNIKMDLQEIGGGRGDWMELAQDRDRWRPLVCTVRNFRVP
jgi:hypothetical protein